MTCVIWPDSVIDELHEANTGNPQSFKFYNLKYPHIQRVDCQPGLNRRYGKMLPFRVSRSGIFLMSLALTTSTLTQFSNTLCTPMPIDSRAFNDNHRALMLQQPFLQRQQSVAKSPEFLCSVRSRPWSSVQSMQAATVFPCVYPSHNKWGELRI